MIGDDPRSFAIGVIRKLQEAGFEALFAGGCVRDQLMGREPKDYDVATSATPEQVREVFGRRKTIAIGAAFGVITVIGSQQSGNVEIATFRADGDYSDGRHPDSVVYTSAENDARRRDFTINGLFFDPIADAVLDYVGGEQDIQRCEIRAIGEPAERFGEDKLRMLRAVRFATTLGFRIEPQTWNAVHELASEIQCVSGERIAAEMMRVLQSEQRSVGLGLLWESGLYRVVLPEMAAASDEDRQAILQSLEQVELGHWSPEISLAAMLWFASDGVWRRQWAAGDMLRADQRHVWRTEIEQLAGRWKLSRQAQAIVMACLKDIPIVNNAQELPWSQVQPCLSDRWAGAVVSFARLLARCGEATDRCVTFCSSWLNRSAEELNPPPLLDGKLLLALGVRSGPLTGKWLRKIREMQLDGELSTHQQAVDYVRQYVERPPES